MCQALAKIKHNPQHKHEHVELVLQTLHVRSRSAGSERTQILSGKGSSRTCGDFTACSKRKFHLPPYVSTAGIKEQGLLFSLLEVESESCGSFASQECCPRNPSWLLLATTDSALCHPNSFPPASVYPHLPSSSLWLHEHSRQDKMFISGKIIGGHE